MYIGFWLSGSSAGEMTLLSGRQDVMLNLELCSPSGFSYTRCSGGRYNRFKKKNWSNSWVAGL